MSSVILDAIPLRVDQDVLFAAMRIKPDSSFAPRLCELIAAAEAVARPKAAYREAVVGERGANYVLVDGQRLEGTLVGEQLALTHTVFPFIATCGREIEAWARTLDDTLEQFWADTLQSLALGAAVEALEKRLAGLNLPGELSCLNPGALEGWPLTEQQAIFGLLGDAPQTLGVELTSSFLMLPLKSVSGVQFCAYTKFVNCRLCAREKCPGRRAPYAPVPTP